MPNYVVSVAPGAVPIYGGCEAPAASYPAWREGMAVDTWYELAGTSGAGGAAVDAFSGFVVRPDTSDIIVALAGGHGATFDNRVVALRLSKDDLTTQGWVQLRASSSSPITDVAYYADGEPASRHTYSSGTWSAENNRLMMHGLYGTQYNAYQFRYVDGFDMGSGELTAGVGVWDPIGTWTDMVYPSGTYSMCQGKNGEVWIHGGVKWNPVADTYTYYTWSQLHRFPAAYDSARDIVFTLNYGDGQGFNPELGLLASTISAAGVQTPATLNASAAKTQLLADAPIYSAMDYDPDNDRFLFYPGAKLGVGPHPNPERVYVVKSDGGSGWDVSILSLGVGSATPSQSPGGGAGLTGRFRYVPAMKGFLLMPKQSSNLYFLPTAV
jgi:hypothetical protein